MTRIESTSLPFFSEVEASPAVSEQPGDTGSAGSDDSKEMMEKLNNLTKAFESLQLQFSDGLKNQATLAQKLQESEQTVAELKAKASTPAPPVPASAVTPEDASMEDPAEAEPKKKAADLAKLRRLCEVKADGTCKVSTELHEMWKGGGAGRSKLLKMFVDSGYDKDLKGLVHI